MKPAKTAVEAEPKTKPSTEETTISPSVNNTTEEIREQIAQPLALQEGFGMSPIPPTEAFTSPPSDLVRTGETISSDLSYENLGEIPIGTIVSLDQDVPEDGTIHNTPELRAIVRSLRPYFQCILGKSYQQQKQQLFKQIQILEKATIKSEKDKKRLNELYDRYLDLHGPYRDLEEIGRGAMGVIYKAKEAGTGTPIALKLARVVEPEQFSRIIRESRALIELGQQEEVLTGYNLIHLGPLNADEEGNGQHGFMIETEFIDGKTFQELVADFDQLLEKLKKKQQANLTDPQKNRPVSRKDLPLHSPLFAMTKTDSSAVLKTQVLNGIKKVEESSKDETLSSEDLANVIKALQDLKTEAIVKLLIPVTRGLEKAHQAGIIHRDVKVNNLMVRKDGRVKIIDWGLNKILDEKNRKYEENRQSIFSPEISDRGTIEVTQEGHYLGTPVYLAPEQLISDEGYHPYANSKSVDVWALGITLFYLLMGKYPFKGPDFTSTALAITQNKREHLKEMEGKTPKLLASIIKKALEHKPAHRFETMKEFQEALLLYEALRNKETLAEYLDKKIEEFKIKNLAKPLRFDDDVIPVLQARFDELVREGRNMDLHEAQNKIKSLMSKTALTTHSFLPTDDRTRTIPAIAATASAT